MADQVSSLFSQKWFEELEKTKTFLTEIDSQIAGLVKDRRDFQIQIKGVDTLKEFNTLAQKLQVLTNNLVSANGKYSNSQARTANTTKLLTAETAKVRVEQQNHNKTMVQGAKEALGLISVYDALSAEHIALSKTARDAGVQFGIESTEFIAASKNANELGTRLSAIDQKLGNYRRNVGNYSSAFDGLGMSIQQILREAPSAAISLNTFFLAISNNLPIFFDELKKASDGLKIFKQTLAAANAEQAIRQEAQAAAAATAKEVEIALAGQIDATLEATAATKEQALALKEQITNTLASAAASAEAAAALSLQAKEMAINAGASLEDAEAIRIQALAASSAAAASAEATLALEAQTVATAEATAAAAAQPSVLARISKSLFSLNTLLTVSVLGLTLFGGKIVDFFTNTSSASGDAAKALKKYEEAIKSSQETERRSSQEDIARINVLTALAANQEQTTRTRMRAIKELQETYPATFGALTKQAILEGKLGDAINTTTQALLNRAAAQAAEKNFAIASEKVYDLTKAQQKATEELAQKNKEVNDNARLVSSSSGENQVRLARQGLKLQGQLEKISDSYDNITKSLDEAQSTQLGFLRDAQSSAALAGDVLFKGTPKEKKVKSPTTNALQQQLEQDLIIQKAITDNESIELEKRIAALDKASIDREGIARIDFQLQKTTAEELKTELAKIDSETFAERNKIIDKYYETYQKEFEAHVKKQEQNALAQADNIHIIYRNQYDNEIEELKKKNLTKRQFEKQSAAIAKRIALDEVNKQIESLEQIRFAYAQLQMDVSDIDKQLETLKDKRSKLNTNKGVDQSAFNTLGVSDEDVSKIQQALDIYGKFSQALTGFTDIFQQQSQHRIDSINAEIEAIKTRSDAEIEALENAGLSEEEKQDKIDEIKARAAEKEQQLLDKRRQEQKKQAAFQKASDIASIISGTAVAVVAALGSKPFTPFNIALAAIVGTLGAAQLTAALASPLPQFYTGTESSPEGLAKVGERGSELMVMPDGRMFVTPNQETIAWLQKGTKIYPHEETKNIMRVLNRDSTQMPTGSITDYKLHSLIKDQTSEIVGAVKRIGNVSVNQRYPGWFSDWSIQKTR